MTVHHSLLAGVLTLLISFSALASTSDVLAPPLPSLNNYQGHQLAAQCAWAPSDRSVCRARTSCTKNLYGERCAKYCWVNPYDVICGDAYRPILEHVTPWRNDSPYPWARNGGSFCRRNAMAIYCIDRQGKYYRK